MVRRAAPPVHRCLGEGAGPQLLSADKDARAAPKQGGGSPSIPPWMEHRQSITRVSSCQFKGQGAEEKEANSYLPVD